MANSINTILNINHLLNTFTKKERVLAEFVVHNYKQILYMSIAELSLTTHVGEATIIRFCHKLGFDGYYAFKMALALDITEVEVDKTEVQENSDSVANTINGLLLNLDAALNGTKALLDKQQINEAVDMILNARKIRVYGIGSSAIAAMDAKYRLNRLGFNIDCCTDGHSMVIDAALSNEKDVVIGISYSGDTKDIIDAFKVATDNSAYTIAITHFKKSILAKYSKNTLLIGSKEGPLQGGTFETKATQMFIIEVLVSEIIQKNEVELLEIKNKTSKALSHKML